MTAHFPDPRSRGLEYYGEDFVARYLFPVLYQGGLTRNAQIVIGGVVLAITVIAYAWLFGRCLQHHRVRS